MKIYFVNTCYAAPEQYEVFDENREEIGFVKLKHGELRAAYPGFAGEKVFGHTFNDNGKEFFFDDEEREEMLSHIAKTLCEKCQCLSGFGNIEFEILSERQWENRGVITLN